jgi:hypothetical protein
MNKLYKSGTMSIALFLVWALSCLIASPAFAYIGPGAGLGAIAVTVALLLGVVLLLGGFVWYPVKRLLRNKKKGKGNADKGE